MTQPAHNGWIIKITQNIETISSSLKYELKFSVFPDSSRNSKNMCLHQCTMFRLIFWCVIHNPCNMFDISNITITRCPAGAVPPPAPRSFPLFHKSAPSNQSVVCQYNQGSVAELDPIISWIKPTKPSVLGSKYFVMLING